MTSSKSKSTFFFVVMLLFIEVKAFTPDYIVAKDGSGNYSTIQEAINAVPPNASRQFIILIKNGTYNEKIFIEKSFITLIGEDRENTKIIFAELRKNWKVAHSDDWGSAVINIKNGVTDLIFKNLTVHNNYGSLFGDNDHQ